MNRSPRPSMYPPPMASHFRSVTPPPQSGVPSNDQIEASFDALDDFCLSSQQLRDRAFECANREIGIVLAQQERVVNENGNTPVPPALMRARLKRAGLDG